MGKKVPFAFEPDESSATLLGRPSGAGMALGPPPSERMVNIPPTQWNPAIPQTPEP
jgi:hypothetical protein